jgi:hypothetical protein
MQLENIAHVNEYFIQDKMEVHTVTVTFDFYAFILIHMWFYITVSVV